jgi:non-specific serine/threonine protein kinase
MLGQPGQSVLLLEEAISLLRELGNFAILAYALRAQSYAFEDLGDSSRARSLTEEGLRISQEVGDKRGIAESYKNLARFALFDGDVDRAVEPLHMAFDLLQPVGDRWLISICLEILAGVSILRGKSTLCTDAAGPAQTEGTARHLLDAVRLYAWADLLRAQVGLDPPPEMRGTPEQNVALLRERLGESAFSMAWGEGRVMSFEAVTEYALGLTATADQAGPDAPPDPRTRADAPGLIPQGDAEVARLTLREREVALLIVEGRTNREIAETLVLSERTVDSHVRNVMSKLAVGARAQIAVWAVQHGLGAHR